MSLEILCIHEIRLCVVAPSHLFVKFWSGSLALEDVYNGVLHQIFTELKLSY